jgi:alpha-ketoglutarate-dependent taurine dioxygenase
MAKIEIRDVRPDFGAEIIGFDPNAPLDAETRKLLQDTFDARGVLLFRDISLTAAQQLQISKMLIRKENADAGEPPQDDYYVSNRKDGAAAPFGRLQFHSDTMWAAHGFESLSLYGEHVEQPAAPTSFVSGTSAWKTLPADLRARVEGKQVLHVAGGIRRGDVTDVLIAAVERPPSTVTDLARRHPRTGEIILYACEQMTKEVVGMDPEESERLLEEVFAHLYDPKATWNHEWRQGDFVVWDNLAMQHARQNVLAEGPARTLRKAASPLLKLKADEIPMYSAAQ